MIHPCDKPCGNKTASGYCATTACINPQYSNIGTAQYGQGVQKRIITNADRIRAMTEEELAMLIHDIVQAEMWRVQVRECITTETGWLDWLKQEYFDNKIGEPITIKPGDVQLSDKVSPDGLI